MDEPPSYEAQLRADGEEPSGNLIGDPRQEVYRTGRFVDAEMVRGRLEADGIDARVWGGGMGVWRVESALTEMTGVPNDFNSYRVMVPLDDAGYARECLEGDSFADDPRSSQGPDDLDDSRVGSLWMLRGRWAILGFAIVFLLIVILIGPPGY